MTPLKKPVRRVTTSTLDGSFGPDADRRIVVSIIPGDGKKIPDCLELKPHRTRRPERGTVQDVYRWLVHCRASRLWMERLRERKAKKAERLAQARQERAEKRLIHHDS